MAAFLVVILSPEVNVKKLGYQVKKDNPAQPIV